MPEEVRHYQINGKYKIQFEQSAVKGVLGFKVEVNSDSIEEAQNEADKLLDYAIKNSWDSQVFAKPDGITEPQTRKPEVKNA